MLDPIKSMGMNTFEYVWNIFSKYEICFGIFWDPRSKVRGSKSPISRPSRWWWWGQVRGWVDGGGRFGRKLTANRLVG